MRIRHKKKGLPPSSARELERELKELTLSQESISVAPPLCADTSNGALVVWLDPSYDFLRPQIIALAAGTTDDLDRINGTWLYLSLSAGAATLTGVSGGIDGVTCWLTNTDVTDSITLAHQGTTSAVGNRFNCPGKVEYILGPGDTVAAIHDGTQWWVGVIKDRWCKLTSTNSSSGITAGVFTVAPASMAGIWAGVKLAISDGIHDEIVTVTSVTGTTFTATFVNSYVPIVTITGALTQVTGGGGTVDYWPGTWYLFRGDLDTMALQPTNNWIDEVNDQLLEPNWFYRGALASNLAPDGFPVVAVTTTKDDDSDDDGPTGFTYNFTINTPGFPTNGNTITTVGGLTISVLVGWSVFNLATNRLSYWNGLQWVDFCPCDLESGSGSGVTGEPGEPGVLTLCCPMNEVPAKLTISFVNGIGVYLCLDGKQIDLFFVMDPTYGPIWKPLSTNIPGCDAALLGFDFFGCVIVPPLGPPATWALYLAGSYSTTTAAFPPPVSRCSPFDIMGRSVYTGSVPNGAIDWQVTKS